MQESLWSLSYLSTKYTKIARLSLDFDQSLVCGYGHNEGLPNDEVIVFVVDNGGDAAVGVDLQEVWGFLLSLMEVEVHRFVRQPKFFENDGDFPKNLLVFRYHDLVQEHTSR